jgi:hypothetical protein
MPALRPWLAPEGRKGAEGLPESGMQKPLLEQDEEKSLLITFQ